MVREPLLLVDGLALRRGGREVCRGLQLRLDAGASGLVLGANGSGKSSLALALTGLLPTTEGSVERPERVGFVPQEPAFPARARVGRYLAELAALGGAGRGAPQQAEEAMRAFGLLEQARRPVGELSRGWRQRLNLARGWLGRPPLVILDEPQTALDPEGMERLQHLIEKEDASFLVLAPPGTGCERLAPLLLELAGGAA